MRQRPRGLLYFLARDTPWLALLLSAQPERRTRSRIAVVSDEIYLGRRHCRTAAQIQLVARLLQSVFYPNTELPKKGVRVAEKGARGGLAAACEMFGGPRLLEVVVLGNS